MKRLHKIPSFNIFTIFSLLLLFLYVPTSASAATPVVVGTTSSYGVLAATTITNTGATTIEGIAGNNMGNFPGTTFTDSGTVTMTGGTIHLGDTAAQNAQLALTTAYEDVRLRGPATTIASNLAGSTLAAGIYVTADTTFSNTGTLTLDGGGDPNAMFFFQAGSTLTTADSVASQMRLINQAQACNVFWQIGSSATLGTYSTFIGHLYAQTSITAKTGAQITGQLLARTGAVTLDTNVISNPGCNHTVTFNSNTGTGGTTPAQTSNAPSALTSNGFTKTGYTFGGWNTVPGGGGTIYGNNAAYSFATDLTLYAQWILAPINHTVTFYGSGSSGGTTAAQTASVTTPLTANGFLRTGYTFTGWNTDAGGGGTAYANSAVYSFATDLALYAQWTLLPLANHTVTFYGNGSTSGATAAQTTNVTTPLTPNGFNRTGHYFLEWNTDSNGGGVAYSNNASYSFAADLNLYAQWAVVPAVIHTVTFMGNGATSGATALQSNNVATALRANGFTRPGYFFKNWNTLPDLSGIDFEDGAMYSFAQDLTLYAKWSLIPPIPHTVTYKGNGATSGTVPLDALSPYSTESIVTVLDNSGSLVKPDYTFVGWNTAANGTSISHPPGSTFSIVIDTILYAQWVPTPVPMATLHVVKEVINDDSGKAVPSDFLLHVKYRGIDIPGSPAIGVGGLGRTYVLPAGSYLVSEDPTPGYYGYFSGIGITNGLVTLIPGSEVTITRTNNDVAQAYVPTPEPTATPAPMPPATEVGGVLPKTGSPWYNLLAGGVILVLIGATGWMARQSRARK